MLEGSEGNIEKEKRPNVERGDILVFDMTTKEIQLFDTRGTLKETIGTFPDFSDEDFHRFAADTAYEANLIAVSLGRGRWERAGKIAHQFK